MKVYLVFQGCYSDRTCMAVFDNEKAAKKYSELIEEKENDYSSIEIFEVNKLNPEKMENRIVYKARIDKTNGELSVYTSNDLVDVSQKIDIYEWNNCIFVESLISKEHAEKVAIEQYQKYTQQQFENGEME